MDQEILTDLLGDPSQPSAARPLWLERVTGLLAHYVVESDPEDCDFYRVPELNAIRPNMAVEIQMLGTTLEEANPSDAFYEDVGRCR